jgi:hypothetical protein
MPPAELLADMGAFNQALIDAGLFVDAGGVKESRKGARVAFSGKDRAVTKGPFRSRQGAPERMTQKMPLLSAIQAPCWCTVIYAPDATLLVRQHRFDGGPFIIAEFGTSKGQCGLRVSSRT